MSNLSYSLMNPGDGDFISVVAQGRDLQSARFDHPNFVRIVELAKADDPKVFDLFDAAKAAAARFERLSERVMVRAGRIYLDGNEINSALTKQVIRFLDEGVEDWKPLVNFFEKVQTNVNEHSREQLYGFLERNSITITPDGDVVFYKGVYPDNSDGETVYRPQYAGYGIVDGVEYTNEKLPQKIGSIVEMPRDMVKHDPNSPCHTGLHAAAYSFAKGFANGTVLEIHVNPRDVVSVPGSANKVRVCRYKVVALAANPHETAVLAAEAPQEVKDQVDEQEATVEAAATTANDKKESTTVPTASARKRYPKPAQFDDLLDRAKRRKQGAEKFISKLQPTWTFHGGDAKERKNWTTN
jgi:hypothetical protein